MQLGTVLLALVLIFGILAIMVKAWEKRTRTNLDKDIQQKKQKRDHTIF